MTTPKSINKIPTWFKLSNYSSAKDLTNQQWANQLMYRATLIFIIEGYISYPSKKMELLLCIRSSGNQMTALDLVNKIQEEGIVIDADLMYRTVEDYDHGQYLSFENPIIRPTSVEDIINSGGLLKKTMLSKTVLEENLSEPYDKIRLLNEVEHQHINDHFHLTILNTITCLQFDLCVPDSQIIAELIKFLPLYRKYLGISPYTNKASAANIQKLIDYQPLPSLDLHIWELYNKKKIRRKKIFKTLFPFIDDINKIKKYNQLASIVKPNAFKAINKAFISMLICT